MSSFGISRMATRLALGAIVLGALGGAGTGCAEERDPINRVQANALPKSFFVGEKIADPGDDPEFYWRNYVVDASASQSLIGVGSWGHVDRVRWEVTEDLLIARKAYQIADGQDNKGVPQKDPLGRAKSDKGFTKTPNGTIVAAYKIQKHFDVRYAYNPQTGEEQNLVEENEVDRPWNERQYMRVDWSKNLVGQTNPMWEEMFTGKVFGNFEVLPVSYAVTDPNSDDRLHYEDKEGYLDITNKYTVTPATSASPFSDYRANVPTCLVVGLFTGSSTYECDPQEATVRSSFKKIDQDHDFEPLENTTATMDIVGNPGGIGDSRLVGAMSAGRQSWDPQYGFTDEGFRRFAYVHNTWKKSHQAAACNVDDDCANETTGYVGRSGSVCDVHVKKCTIPYRDREVKTIGYWVNKEAPDELQDPVGADGKPTARGTLEDLTHSWNQLMRVAVATAREVECRRAGDGDRNSCHAEFFDSNNDPGSKEMLSYGGWLVEKTKDPKAVLTMCHNPVREYDDHETCGATGYRARVGDIRHNFIFYWPYDSRAPWGGVANWNADPLTGEIIGAAAAIMGRSATMAAAQQRDIISLELGDAKIEELIEGSQEARFAKSLTDGHKEAPRGLTPEEMKRRTGNVDKGHLVQSLGAHPTPGKNQGEKLLATLKRDQQTTSDLRVGSTALVEYDALASNLRGTKYEAELVDSHYLVGALGMSPTQSLDDTLMEAASPLRGMDPGRMHAMREAAAAGLHARGVCFMDNEAPAVGSIFMGSLAGYFKQKYGDLNPTERGKRIYEDLWKDAVKGIALHEIGHSLGMLHQFASSWDSPNYNPQYWQLRTNEGQSTTSCEGKPRTGPNDTCMGPRYLDPETDDELGHAGESRPGILYFANTSTMEYQIERAGETVGLGTYDQHAMKALYGRVLETFDDSVFKSAAQQDFRFKNWSQLVDADLVIDGSSLRGVHYTELARKMKVFDAKRDCRPATDDEKATAGWRIVHGKVCAPAPKDHWRWRDFKSDSVNAGDPEFNAPYWHVVDSDGKERVRWPYRWGSSDNSYFHTNDSDAGADAYEVAVNTRKKFEATYAWTYFRRKSREYNYRNIPSTVADRYFERMRSYHWQIATDLARNPDDAALEDDNDMRPEMMAQQEVFDLLARALLMPEPGTYFEARSNTESAMRQPVDSIKSIFDTVRNAGGVGVGAPRPAFSIGIGEGRFIGEDYNNTLGGSWDYLNFINHAGFTVEKALALQALVDGRPSLSTITRDNFLDGRAMKVNFRNDLPHAVDRLIGGILAEDWESIAPGVVVQPEQGEAQPLMLDLTTRTLSPKRPADALVVFPNVGYKQQLATAVYTAIFSRLGTDMTLMNKMRVWLDGQNGQIAVPDAEQVRYTDPTSGYTYVARKYGTENIDGKPVDRGIASRMIAHANAMLAAAYEIDDSPITNPTVTPASTRDAYGRPRLKRDENGQPIVKSPELAGQLDKYVGLVDALREIELRLGYGPLGAGSIGNGGDD